MSFAMTCLPGLSRDQIQSLLKELKEEGVIVAEGMTRASKWYPAVAKTQSDANDSMGEA
jgi:hypothetical protein